MNYEHANCSGQCLEEINRGTMGMIDCINEGFPHDAVFVQLDIIVRCRRPSLKEHVEFIALDTQGHDHDG